MFHTIVLKKKKGPKRKPCMNLREFADYADMKYPCIYERMKNDKKPLEVLFKVRGTRYYDLESLIKWNNEFEEKMPLCE